MLPDIRAVIAAIVAAAGLLMVSFGLVAMFRVAQEHHSGSLQADLAKRGRPALPDSAAQRAVMIIDTPGPHLAPVKAAPPPEASATPVAETAPLAEPAPVVQVEAAPVTPVAAAPPAEAPQATPPAEPPIGGPFAPAPVAQTEASRSAAPENSGKAEKIAAEKARKARVARIARERKVAKRAAQVRRTNERSNPSPGGANQFGNNVNQLGGTFRQ
jgi:hypothetical protein